MLHIQDMAFAYPGTGEILKKISFDLEEGHCLALLGNNGAGKSTLLKCLNRIHEPKEGVIEVRGQNVHAMKRGDIAKTMAYVAQQSEGTQLTVFDSILLGRKPYIKMNPTDEDIAIAQRAMKRMELEPFALRYTDELSGGELQKVVLARALAQEPKILLLDEPTSNLDLYNQHEVLRVVSQIAKTDKTAVVVIIHDLNLALRYCDRFLLIQDGIPSMPELHRFLLSVGQSMEDIQRDYLDADIPLWEAARAVHNILERGESLDDSQRFIARSADEFGEDETEFVWYPFVPVGDYTVLMADGGTGKTILCCGIAAAISKGEALPGDYFNEWSNTPGNTLIISAEDRGELLKKRLAASGADLKNVYILDCMDSEGMDFTDGYEDFVQTIKRYTPRLVIIDPWHAFLGAGVDINRVNAVRPVFQRLANMAKVCNCGMILVSHVNKRAQGENANNAATGSTDFINAARSAMRVIFNDEPGMKDTRILVHTKSNYAEPGKSVVYQILKNSGCNWAGFSEITRKTLEDAARWRKTPHEVIKQLATQAETNSALIEAITEKAIPGKTVNISYDEMRLEYGEDIFGSGQPKKALAIVAADLKEIGITIQTGKTVKYDGKTRNGFGIFQSDRNAKVKDEPEEIDIL